jgi:hypothetical protein
LFITEFVFESTFNQIDGGSGKVVTKGKEFFLVSMFVKWFRFTKKASFNSLFDLSSA